MEFTYPHTTYMSSVPKVFEMLRCVVIFCSNKGHRKHFTIKTLFLTVNPVQYVSIHVPLNFIDLFKNPAKGIYKLH